jgi:hypothetical protein
MIDVNIGGDLTSDGTDATVGFGPWSVERMETTISGNTITISSICELFRYMDNDIVSSQFDSRAKTSQAFSMMAIVLSLPLFIAVLLPCCCDFGRGNNGAFLLLGALCVFTAFASWMSLVSTSASSKSWIDG